MKFILYSKSFLNLNVFLYNCSDFPWFLINIYNHVFCMHETFFSFFNPISHILTVLCFSLCSCYITITSWWIEIILHKHKYSNTIKWTYIQTYKSSLSCCVSVCTLYVFIFSVCVHIVIVICNRKKDQVQYKNFSPHCSIKNSTLSQSNIIIAW